MYPEILGLSTYSIFTAIGVASMFLLFIFELFKRLKPSEKEIGNMILILGVSLVAGFFGAMLLDSLFHIPDRGGFVIQGITFYGALLAGLCCFIAAYKIFAKKADFKIPLKSYLNALAPCIALGHFFGRVGCFFGGCCYGGVTEGPFGVYFPEGSHAFDELGHVKVYPTQLFEAAVLLGLFFFLYFAKQEKIQKNRIYIYLGFYAVARFLLEFLRGDSRGGLFGVLSPAQALSIGIAVFLILFLPLDTYIQKRKQEKV